MLQVREKLTQNYKIQLVISNANSNVKDECAFLFSIKVIFSLVFYDSICKIYCYEKRTILLKAELKAFLKVIIQKDKI